jgi:hypothetical protein
MIFVFHLTHVNASLNFSLIAARCTFSYQVTTTMQMVGTPNEIDNTTCTIIFVPLASTSVKFRVQGLSGCQTRGKAKEVG